MESEKFLFYGVAFDPIKFRHVSHLKMTVSTSFLWKIIMQLEKKWPEMVLRWPNSKVVSFEWNRSIVVKPSERKLAKRTSVHLFVISICILFDFPKFCWPTWNSLIKIILWYGQNLKCTTFVINSNNLLF